MILEDAGKLERFTYQSVATECSRVRRDWLFLVCYSFALLGGRSDVGTSYK